MSLETMSTESNAADDDAHCHMNDEQLITSSSTTLARQITEANEIRSPLMRLPAEIRAIILRMLVGDKLIHINTRERFVRCSRRWVPEGLDEGNWTLARSLPVDDGDSDDDPVDYYEISRWGYSFDILDTSHQLHEEVFFLFWRTCQFIFWEKVALAEFLDRIGEAQKANLRRLVFISELEYSYDWHFTRGQDPWEFCYTKVLDEIPLKHVCDIVLYLKIRENSWNDPTFADRKASAIKSFESFEPLRLLALKEAKVILSFPRIISPLIDEQFQAKEKACLEDTLSKRLLDPTLTKVDLVDALSKRIKRLERSEGEAQTYAESSLNQAEESQRSADRYREAAKGWHMIADQERATIEELEVVLQEAEEVDDQARLVW